MIKILLVGCGHMGSALLTKWIKNKRYSLSVIDPIKYNNSFLNTIMIKLDRGKFIRNKMQYEKLMDSFDSFVIDDFYKMNFQNVYSH